MIVRWCWLWCWRWSKSQLHCNTNVVEKIVKPKQAHSSKLVPLSRNRVELFMWALDGRIMRCGIISSCQSAAISEIVKALLSTSPSHVKSAIIESTVLYSFLPFYLSLYRACTYNAVCQSDSFAACMVRRQVSRSYSVSVTAHAEQCQTPHPPVTTVWQLSIVFDNRHNAASREFSVHHASRVVLR